MTLAKPLLRPRTDRPSGHPTPLMAPVPSDGGRLRRCTFRKIEIAAAVPPRGRALPVYEVTCLYPDLKQSLPLGDLGSARAICNACVAPGVFRPDED
jgi:hypothetical protein